MSKKIILQNGVLNSERSILRDDRNCNNIEYCAMCMLYEIIYISISYNKKHRIY